MRKTLTIPAIALAASMALGSAATASAATSPTAAAAPTATAGPAGPTAALTTTPTTTPQPGSDSLALSTDFGRPGDKVTVTVRTGEKSAAVKSQAFTGGQVELKSDGKGTWTGTATVAKDVRTGYYGVQAFAGSKQFDTVKFSTEAGGTPDVKPQPTQPVNPPHPRPQPLRPSEHKKPKGSVNTGEAPAGTPAGTPAGSLPEPGHA
ncbi:hypothetical protein [Streptomyces virginiae]|uniref:hypothetical protein n=1 Tax=Streptomyces virginiae TaxID=1961 RepID=UPI0036936EC9